MCLLYTSGLHRFDFYCDGELVPTFSRFKRVHTPRSRVVAVFVGDHCDYRFSVDTLPCGKRALRELRRRLASQFSYWKARRNQERVALRNPVSFVRSKGRREESPRCKRVEESPTTWGRLPGPGDSRVVGTPLELPARSVLRSVPKQDRCLPPTRADGQIPLREVSSFVLRNTSDKHGDAYLPICDPPAFPDHRVSDLAAVDAVSRFERVGALREVSSFVSPLADRFGSVAEPTGGGGAFERLEIERFGASGAGTSPASAPSPDEVGSSSLSWTERFRQAGQPVGDDTGTPSFVELLRQRASREKGRRC